MQAPRNASLEQARQQSIALLNQHLAAAVILRDRMRRSSRNLMGENFIMIDGTCDQVASPMDACTMLIPGRLYDLGGTVRLPVLLHKVMSEQSLRHLGKAGQLVNELPDAEPLDAVGQSVLDCSHGGNGLRRHDDRRGDGEDLEGR